MVHARSRRPRLVGAVTAVVRVLRVAEELKAMHRCLDTIAYT